MVTMETDKGKASIPDADWRTALHDGLDAAIEAATKQCDGFRPSAALVAECCRQSFNLALEWAVR